MPYDFSAEYSQRTDDELLHLATRRHSLTPEAAAALDVELHRRNLSESDRVEHERFVKRQEHRENRTRRPKIFGLLKDHLSFLDLLWAGLVIALTTFVYLKLPGRYHFKSGWQEPALLVLSTSVLVVVASRHVLWRRAAFWVSLAISSLVHLELVHALLVYEWKQGRTDFARGEARGALVLGMILFLAIYGMINFVQRKFRTDDIPRRRPGLVNAS